MSTTGGRGAERRLPPTLKGESWRRDSPQASSTALARVVKPREAILPPTVNEPLDACQKLEPDATMGVASLASDDCHVGNVEARTG